MNFFIIIWFLAIAVGFNLLGFIITFFIKKDFLTDISYSLTFIILGIFVVAWKQNFSPVQIILFILYNMWSLRLGGYLLFRIIKTKVDHRFDNLRNSFWKLGCFWLLQALSVFIISLPTLFALNIPASYFNNSFNYFLLIPIFLASLFLIIETVADIQKFRFHLKKHANNLFINYGLWKDSRHPNYFGEIGFWYMMVAIFLVDFWIKNLTKNNLNYLYHALWLLSPFYLNILIIFVSGVPMLEKKAWEKYGTNETYQAYIKKVPCVVFYIGKKGKIKRI